MKFNLFLLIVSFFLTGISFTFSQCGCNRVVVIVDNSGSISSTEFTDMKRSIDSISSKLLRTSSKTKVAIVQYGSQNTSNHTYHISVPFTNTISTASTWQRAYAAGGVINNTYYQDHLPGSLSKMRRDSIWQAGKQLDLVTDSCNTSFIIFTDALYGSSGCCSNLVNNDTTLAPLAMKNYGEYNYLKNTYSSRFSTYHVSFSPPSFIAGAAISSVGGSYTGSIDTNPGDPEGSTVLPRIYYQNTSFVIPTSSCNAIVSSISKSFAKYSADSVCVGDTTNIQFFGANIPGWFQWSFGDGSIDSTDINPKHLYSSSGTYPVTMIYSDSVKTCFDTIQDSVIVYSSINSNYNINVSCKGLPTYFTAASTGTHQSTTWDFSDGNFSSNFPSLTHIYGTASTFTTSLTIKNSSSCFDSTQKTITIKDFNSAVRKTTTSLSAWDTTGIYQWLDCDAGYAVLPGETNWSFIPSRHGRYALQYSKNGCIDTSQCFNFLVTGINELKNNLFTVFPNPADDKITVSISGNSLESTIRIFDPQGKLIATLKPKNRKETIDVTNLKKGVYLIEVDTKVSRMTKKFIKE